MKNRPKRFRGITLKKAWLARGVRKTQRLAPEDAAERLEVKYTFPGRHAHVDSFLAKEFVRHLKKGSRLRFLDLGVAPGPKGAVTTLEAVRKFSRAGVDVEAHAVDKASPPSQVPLNFSGGPRGVVYHKLDVEQNDLPVRNADIIRASNLLKYVSDKKTVREKIVSALREGGLYVETSPPYFFGPEEHGHWAISVLFQKREGKLVPIQIMPSAPPAQVLGLERPPAKRLGGLSAREWFLGYREGVTAAKREVLPQVEKNAKVMSVERLRKNAAAREAARKLFVERRVRE
ncbi:MAG: hypothetical protein AB1626_02235 [Candidatus Micrarchaeota archaeon]